MKAQGIQLLPLRSRDHLLHLRQLLGLGAAGLKGRQDGLDPLGFLQKTPVRQAGKQSVRMKAGNILRLEKSRELTCCLWTQTNVSLSGWLPSA